MAAEWRLRKLWSHLLRVRASMMSIAARILSDVGVGKLAVASEHSLGKVLGRAWSRH